MRNPRARKTAPPKPEKPPRTKVSPNTPACEMASYEPSLPVHVSNFLNEVYWHAKDRNFWWKNSRGIYEPHVQDDLSNELKWLGVPNEEKTGKGRFHPHVATLRRIRAEQAVDVVAEPALAGFMAGVHEINGYRVLVPRSPAIPQPVKGEFPVLHKLLSEFSGAGIDPDAETQYLAWSMDIGQFTKSVRANKTRFVHGLVFVGAPGVGKSFLQEVIISMCLGGKKVKAEAYFTTDTEFTAGNFAAEHLMVADGLRKTDRDSRRLLTDKIKNIVTGQAHSYHAKGKTDISLSARWLLTFSANAGELIGTLPVIDEDSADKICLFKIYPGTFPDMGREEEYERFMDAIRAEIPAYLHFCENLVVPDSLREKRPRFGYEAFHHPEILAQLNDMAPETSVLEEIIQAYPLGFIELLASKVREDLLNRLTGTRQAELAKLIKTSNYLGTLLGRLKRRYPGVISGGGKEGHKADGTHWSFNPSALNSSGGWQ